MKRLFPCLGLLAVLFAACLAPVAYAQASSTDATDKKDEFQNVLGGPAMQSLTVTQRQMAVLMRQANEALQNGGDPSEVAKKFYADLAAIEGLKSPMVALNDLKTRLTNLGLADITLGEKFPLGGTPVERALLVYRRDLTMDCIRAAVADVTRRFGADATGKVFLAKIGKWAVQDPDMFMLAGDIDFSFMGARPEVIIALRDAYGTIITERSGGLDMVAIDSVATAHGFAKYLVYMGIQGRKFADDAMIAMETGVEQIDFQNPNSVGTAEARQISGKQALTETLLEETALRYRAEGLEEKGRTLANETDKAWNDRRNQTVEPMLSMEMARHLGSDIVAKIDVFTVLDIIKKGSKYLRRSNDQTTADLKLSPADAKWAKFAVEIDELAKTAPTEKLVSFIYNEMPKLGMKGVFDYHYEGPNPVLEAVPGATADFLARTQSLIWRNVANGFDTRIRTFTDALNNRGAAAGPGTPDDLRADRIADTIRMLAAGLDAMQHENSPIPADIVSKATTLTKLVEQHARQRAFTLPQEEMKKIREVLREATANENSLLLKTAVFTDHIDKLMTKNYDALSARVPESMRAGLSLADAKIDALNNLLDFLDNSTVAAMRERGIIKAPIPTGISEDGKVQFLKVAEFPSLGAINARLNQSILGKVANHTAFKAFNISQEGDAYYTALMQASTPSEAFQNLAVEIFRRRVPGGGAVEALAMENYVRASVEVVYLLFPPAAVPEGLYGIAMSVSNKYDAWWWSAELERYVDTFYAGAEFDLLESKNPSEKPRYRLTALTIKHPGSVATYERAVLEMGTANFLQNPEVDKTLWANLAVTDPFIELMDELKQHEAAGEKVRAHFQSQIDAHWAKLKADFGRGLIERFENRKASELAIDLGEVPGLYAELFKLADELEIKDQLQAAMEKEWDSGYLQRLWVWLKADKRAFWKEAPPEAEKTRSVTILRKHLDAYRKVSEARTATEAALDGLFDEAQLARLPHERDNRRVLTGIMFLRGAPAQDVALAARLQALPAATHENVQEQFDTIVTNQAPGAKRDGTYDREMAAKITGEVFWIAALRATRVPVIAKADLDRTVDAHAAASDRFFAEFTAHYVNLAGAVTVRVRQWIDDAATEQPVPGAALALTDAAGQPVGTAFRELADGTYQTLGVNPGRYTLKAGAPGFGARSGAALEKLNLGVGSDKASREFTVFLKSGTGTKELAVTLAASLEPALIYTRGATNSIELRATVAAQKDSGQINYQWALGDEVLLQGTGESKVTFSATGRKPGDAKVSVFVTDEKYRNATGAIAVRIADGEPLKVVFGGHRAEMFKNDSETIAVIEPKPGTEFGLKYQWSFKNAAGKEVFAPDGPDKQLIAGQNYAGQTLSITVTVRDRDGRTGTAKTSLIIRDDEKPAPLPVSITPASGTMIVGDSLTLRAAAEPFPDSGEIQYSWDDGKTWSAVGNVSEIKAEANEAGTIQSITVMARDKRGRVGEATAGIRVEKADAGPLRLAIEGPTEVREGESVNLTSRIVGASEARMKNLEVRWFDGSSATPTPLGTGFTLAVKGARPGTLPVLAYLYEKTADNFVFVVQANHALGVAPAALGKVIVEGPTVVAVGGSASLTARAEVSGMNNSYLQYVWSDGLGEGSWVSVPTAKPAVLELTVKAMAVAAGRSVVVAEGRHRIAVTDNRLALPEAVNATDFFAVSVKVPAELAGRVAEFQWSGAPVLDEATGQWGYSSKSPTVKMQYGFISPSSNPADKVSPSSISVTLVDATGKALMEFRGELLVRPVSFSGSATDAWNGGARADSVSLQHKGIHGGDGQGQSGAFGPPTAWATLDARVISASEFHKPGSIQAALQSKADAWKMPISAFSIGDFSGFIVESPAVSYSAGFVGADGYQGSGAGRTASGIVVKGNCALAIKIDSGTGGAPGYTSDEGVRVDRDRAWQLAKIDQLLGEMKGIATGLKLTPDGKFQKTPYKGPALDGSDDIAPLSVSVAGPAVVRSGQTGTVTATVTGGRPPYKYEWSGDHGGDGAKVTVLPTKAGAQKLIVTVTSTDNQKASATHNYTIEKVTASITGLEAPVIFGTERKISLKTNVDPKTLRVIWQAEPNVTFSPPVSTTDGATTVRIDRMPEKGLKIWAQLANASDGGTIGETQQVNVKVVAPKFSITFEPTAAKIGQEVTARITVTPAPIDPALLSFQWSEPASSVRRELDHAATAITFTPRDTKPISLLARGIVPTVAERVGEVSAKFTATGFKLGAKVVEPGTRPMIWKEGVGLVPVTRGSYAGDEQVTVEAKFEGEQPPGEIRWSWTANEGTSVSNPVSQTPQLSRHETGTATATVTAKDKNDILLGTATASLNFTVTADAVKQALQPKVTLKADRKILKTGETVGITTEVRGGKTPYTYAWRGANPGDTGPSIALKPTAPGPISVDVTVTDSAGKTAAASVDLDVQLSERDRARQDAERAAARALELATQGDFDAALRLIEEARRNDAAVAAPVARQIAQLAKAKGHDAEQQRDFASSGKLYTTATKLDPQDVEAARGANNAPVYAKNLAQVRSWQGDLDQYLQSGHLDRAEDRLSELKNLESTLPGALSAETQALAQRYEANLATYRSEMAAFKKRVAKDFSEDRLAEARAQLEELRKKPLLPEDESWADGALKMIADKEARRAATAAAVAAAAAAAANPPAPVAVPTPPAAVETKPVAIKPTPVTRPVVTATGTKPSTAIAASAAATGPLTPLAGEWQVNFNNYPGVLEITSTTATLDLGDGPEKLTNVRVDPSSGAVTFTRPLVKFSAGNQQVYTGRLTRDGHAEGTFDCTVSGPGYRWTIDRTARAAPTAATTQAPIPAPAPAPTPAPAAKPQSIFNNWNTGGVGSGPTAPTTFSIDRPLRVTYVNSYHYNFGRGTKAGTLALRHSDGSLYGPWRTRGINASGSPDGLWECEPGVVLKPGTYTVVDSEPATWAQNGQSGGRGFVEVRGVWADTRDITPPAPPSGPPATTLKTPAGVSVDMSAAMEPWMREWTLTATSGDLAGGGPVGFFASGRRGDANPPPGRTGLLYTHPAAQGVPAKLERQVHLNRAPVLHLSLAGNSPNGGTAGDWQLIVKVNGTAVGAPRNIDGSAGWLDLDYDLSAFANRDSTVVIEGHPTGWFFEYVFIDAISLTDGTATTTTNPSAAGNTPDKVTRSLDKVTNGLDQVSKGLDQVSNVLGSLFGGTKITESPAAAPKPAPVPAPAAPQPSPAAGTAATSVPATGKIVTATYENHATQNIHIFVEGRDTFDPRNRVTPGEKRFVKLDLPADGRLKFVAGRDGKVLARATWNGDPSDTSRYPVVRYVEDGGPTLLVTTALR